MTASPDIPPNLAAFAEVADAYCSLIEGSAGSGPARLLLGVQDILPRLYSAGLGLPNAWKPRPASLADADALDESGDDTEHDPNAAIPIPDAPISGQSQELTRRIGDQIAHGRYYSLVFSPYSLEDPDRLVGDLADDLGDIYRDLHRGRAKYRQGRVDEAAWEWQSHFGAHWGRRAVDAIRALHALAFDQDIGADVDSPR